MESHYRIINNTSQLEELISSCKKTGYASVDFETNGLNPRSLDFYPTILGVSFQIGSGWIIPLGHKDSIFRKRYKRILRKFGKEVIENPSITKVVWNGLFEYRVFYHYGIIPRGRFFDAMLMKYLLKETRPNDLKSQVDTYIPDFAGYDLPHQPSKKASKKAIKEFWENVELEELAKYCSLDVDNTFRLALHYEGRLIKHGLYGLFRNMYSTLIPIMGKTIYNGVHVDRVYLKYMLEFFSSEIDKKDKELRDIDIIRTFNETFIEDKVEEFIENLQDEIDNGSLSVRQIESREEKISRLEAGEPTTKKEKELFESINFGSPKQLIQLLYESGEGFEFPILERSKTGAPSTAEGTLLKLKPQDTSGFIQALLEIRSLNKLYSTYIKSVYEDHLTPEDRIHPSYLLHGTLTSRLSSRSINFQNIPRDKGEGSYDSYIKNMFIAPDGYYFTEIDGSQMELRVAAELSGDKAMVDIYNQGKNIHVQTAALVFGADYDKINKARKDPNNPDHDEMKKKHKAAKVLNFTIFYGAGPAKVAELLSESTGVKHSKEEAAILIENWFEAFPTVGKWIKTQRKLAKRKGYVKTMFGFKRRLPILLEDPRSLVGKDKWEYAEAERQSVNSIIQGSASNITQWVNIQIYQAVLRGELPPYLRLVSTVHDSLEYYIKKEDVNWVIPILLRIASTLPEMDKFFKIRMEKVPMKFSAELGINWGRMYEFNPKLDYIKFYTEEVKTYSTTSYPHHSFAIK